MWDEAWKVDYEDLVQEIAVRLEIQVTLVCPRVRRNYRECGFSFADPASWDNLSASTRLAPTLELFKSMLKTELFKESYPG